MPRRVRRRFVDDVIDIEAEVRGTMAVLFRSLYFDEVWREMPTAAQAAQRFEKLVAQYASRIRVRANNNAATGTVYHHIRWAQTHSFFSGELMVRLYKHVTDVNMWTTTHARHSLKEALAETTQQLLCSGMTLFDVADLVVTKPLGDNSWQDKLRLGRNFSAAAIRRLTHEWGMLAWPHDGTPTAWHGHWFRPAMAVIESGELVIRKPAHVEAKSRTALLA